VHLFLRPPKLPPILLKTHVLFICVQENCKRGVSLLLVTAFVGLAMDSTSAGVAAGLFAALCTSLLETGVVFFTKHLAARVH
jgi:hypothetical protein